MARIWFTSLLLTLSASRRTQNELQVLDSEFFEYDKAPRFSLDILSQLTQGADELQLTTDALVDTLEFSTSPNVKAAGKALMSVGSVVISIPMPPVTQIVGGVLGIVGAVMSVFGPEGKQSDAHSSREKDRLKLSDTLASINSQIGELVDGVKKVDAKIDEVLLLQRETYRHEVLGGKVLKEIESRYNQLFKYVLNSLKDPSLTGSAIFQAKAALEHLGHTSYAKGALTSTNLKKYLQFVRGSSGDVVAAQAFKSFIAARFQLFWVVWTATIYMEGKVSLNSVDHMSRLQKHMKEYDEVVRSVLGKTGLTKLGMTNAEIIKTVEQSTRNHKQSRLVAATTTATTTTMPATLFDCPRECQECCSVPWLFGKSDMRFKCVLKRTGNLPADRNCTAPKQRKASKGQQEVQCDFTAAEKASGSKRREELQHCSSRSKCCCSKSEDWTEYVCLGSGGPKQQIGISPSRGTAQTYRQTDQTYSNTERGCQGNHRPLAWQDGPKGVLTANRGCCIAVETRTFRESYYCGGEDAVCYKLREWRACVAFEQLYHCGSENGLSQKGSRYMRVPPHGICIGDKTNVFKGFKLALDGWFRPKCPAGYSSKAGGQLCKCGYDCGNMKGERLPNTRGNTEQAVVTPASAAKASRASGGSDKPQERHSKRGSRESEKNKKRRGSRGSETIQTRRKSRGSRGSRGSLSQMSA